MYEKDFLRGYELRNWEFTPRFYKIVAVSAIFNLLFIVVFAQTNLLTRKGCESPFVRTVCQVIDTVYVGTSLIGVENEYSVRDYNKTEIGENDEITMIDTTGETPPLSYPEGYFAIANPENFVTGADGELKHVSDMDSMFSNQTTVNPNTMNPTIVTPPPTIPQNNNLASKPPVYPKYRNPIKRDKLPTSVIIDGDDGEEKDKPDGTETAENNPDIKKPNKEPKKPKIDERAATNSNSVETVEINKKPLEDVGNFAKAVFTPENDFKGELKPFKITLNGKLKKKIVKIKDETGKVKDLEVIAFDPQNTKWDQKAEKGDKEMIGLAKESIEAVGDSGFLGHLYNLGADNIQITLEQVDDKIIAVIKLDNPNSDKARSVASGLNVLLEGAKFVAKEDEKILLNSVKPPTSEGKFVILNVEIPKEEAEKMIQRNLKKDALKKQQEKNSTAQTLTSNVNTGR